MPLSEQFLSELPVVDSLPVVLFDTYALRAMIEQWAEVLTSSQFYDAGFYLAARAVLGHNLEQFRTAVNNERERQESHAIN